MSSTPTWTDAPEYGCKFQAAVSDGNGACTPLDLKQVVSRLRSNKGLVWLNLAVHDPALAEPFLVQKLQFHELAIEDALHEGERPTVHEFEDELSLTLIQVTDGEDEDHYREIGVFLGEGFLVTLSVHEIEVLSTSFARWFARPAAVAKNAAMLLHTIFDTIVDAYFPVTDVIEEAVDDLEDSLHAGQPVTVPEILRLKRRLHEMRRRLSPTRDTLNTLLRRDITLVPDTAKMYFQDVYDHSLRVMERIDLNRDILSDVLDAHLSVVSNNLNVVMKALTVLSTVLMSLALVAGIYGMNFRYMPELRWPHGYAFALGVMVFIALAEVWFFRRKGWI